MKVIDKTTVRVINLSDWMPTPASVRAEGGPGYSNRWRKSGYMVAAHAARWSNAKKDAFREHIKEFLAEHGGTEVSDADINYMIEYSVAVFSKADVSISPISDASYPGRFKLRVDSDRDGSNEYHATLNKIKVVEV